jgi:hypothetical protein
LIFLMFSNWPVCKILETNYILSLCTIYKQRSFVNPDTLVPRKIVRITKSPMIDVHAFCFPGIPSGWWSIRINGVLNNGANQRIISYWLQLNVLPCYVWSWYHPWL